MSIAREMLKTQPAPELVNPETLAACIRNCFECAQACTACADACLNEADVAALARCIRMNLNCADVCQATGQVLARPTEQEWGILYNQLQAGVVACQVCAAECEKHAHLRHCQVCAQACRRCETVCLDLFKALSRP
jgi:hypothetical protein